MVSVVQGVQQKTSSSWNTFIFYFEQIKKILLFTRDDLSLHNLTLEKQNLGRISRIVRIIQIFPSTKSSRVQGARLKSPPSAGYAGPGGGGHAAYRS